MKWINKGKQTKMIIALSVLIIALTSSTLYSMKFKPEVIGYKEFIEMVDSEKVETIDLMKSTDEMLVVDKDGEKYKATNPNTDKFKEDMLKKGIDVKNKNPASSLIVSSISTVLQIAMFALIIILLTGVVAGSKNKKKSLIESEDVDKDFNSIAGNEEAKEDMKFLVNFLKDPKKYEDMGAKLPKGVVFYGPPGTGKTLMAKAVAGEAGVPFYAVTGSDFVEMFVGVGAKRVRELFKQAKENSPSIVFIDEIDSVGASRGSNQNSEMTQTINALLAEMDGFESDSQVIVIAATNRIEDLDEALIRPGRFDRHVSISLPDYNGRLAILKNYAKGKNLHNDISLQDLAKLTIGFSGAGLEALMNEASIIAVNNGSNVIRYADVDDSLYKIMTKGNRKNDSDQLRDKSMLELVAYHEAGHALVTKLLTSNQIHKITIVPSTSGFGGYVFSTPKQSMLISKKELLNSVRVMYAGRAAEEILKGNTEDVTSGASSDIQQATKYIDSYFSELGMSEEFGMLAVDRKSYVYEAINLSKILYAETLELLQENKDLLGLIAKELIEKETLTGYELDEILSPSETNTEISL